MSQICELREAFHFLAWESAVRPGSKDMWMWAQFHRWATSHTTVLTESCHFHNSPRKYPWKLVDPARLTLLSFSERLNIHSDSWTAHSCSTHIMDVISNFTWISHSVGKKTQVCLTLYPYIYYIHSLHSFDDVLVYKYWSKVIHSQDHVTGKNVSYKDKTQSLPAKLLLV